MRLAALFLCLGLPHAASAQNICLIPSPVRVDPCMVGLWEANTNMAARMQAIMDSVPASMRTQFEGRIDPMFGKNLMIAIYPDGYYVASPLQYGTIEGAFISGDNRTNFTLDMVVSPADGWLATGDGMLAFCTNDGAGAAVTGAEAHSTVDGSMPSFGAADSAFGPSPLSRVMPYTCTGDTMLMTMALPEPIGLILYDLQKIPVDRVSLDLLGSYEDRFSR
ncbi:MAG: hypothetical protein R3D84_16370 [Paracoccaceae bacterium]